MILLVSPVLCDRKPRENLRKLAVGNGSHGHLTPTESSWAVPYIQETTSRVRSFVSSGPVDPDVTVGQMTQPSGKQSPWDWFGNSDATSYH